MVKEGGAEEGAVWLRRGWAKRRCWTAGIYAAQCQEGIWKKNGGAGGL